MADHADPNPVGWGSKKFRVNLETVNRQGHLVPNRTQTTGNETVAEADNQKNTRGTWIPDKILNNHAALKHGDTFTASGEIAYKLKATYVTGSVNDVLQIVSES
jgi:hypothetical protein